MLLACNSDGNQPKQGNTYSTKISSFLPPSFIIRHTFCIPPRWNMCGLCINVMLLQMFLFWQNRKEFSVCYTFFLSSNKANELNSPHVSHSYDSIIHSSYFSIIMCKLYLIKTHLFNIVNFCIEF